MKYGGLNLIDLETYVKSSRLAWLNRIFSGGSSPWKAYIKYLLEDFGGVFLFSCNYDVKDCKVTSTFYRELLQWWADLRITFSTRPSISYNIIWNNKDIKIDNKTIYYSNYIKAGILLINHLQFNKNNIESFNSAKSKGLKHSNFLVWSGVRAAVPAHLKSLDVIESELECPLEFHCGEKKINPIVCKNKHFYELLVSDKAKVSRGFAKLKEDFGLADSAVTKAFLKVKTVSSEMFIRSFQFKILSDITFTNSRLAKIGYVQDDSCTFCRVSPETVNHLFYECTHTNQFWKDFKNFWFALSGKHVELSLQDVMIGKLDEVSGLLNYFLTVAKWHIWTSRKRCLSPDIAAFKEVINMKYKTEKYIAVKNNTQRKFQARWKLFIDS